MSPPPKNSDMLWARCFDCVRMLTTNGEAALAMFLNVVASTGPASGALLADGTASDWASERGARSRREASTMPTASDATAISTA